ncbi:endonuclease [Helicobacter pylori]|nr:endonuclease [Helicobacter pylori]UOR36906.1 endonuclease [Helicobacter pylori]
MKEKFDSNEYIFSDEELERIIEIPPQQHKGSLCGNDRLSKK